MHQILKITNFEDKTVKNSVFFIYLMLQKFKALLLEHFKYIQIRFAASKNLNSSIKRSKTTYCDIPSGYNQALLANSP